MVMKLAKITDSIKNTVDVGLGDNEEFYKSLGMTEMDVEQAYDGCWYLSGYAPTKPLDQELAELESKYGMPRVIREGILANPSMYSQFNVNRAKELEELAKKIRDLKEGK